MQPLHKKKSRADAGNYRGIHLTPQLSKIVERIIGMCFLPWVHEHAKFGEHQYAYGPGRSHRDALAVNICGWLMALEDGNLIALYCSDVSGAFDRVSAPRLTRKLAALGLHPRIFAVLSSWLEPRVSTVVVEGAFSSGTVLRDSVFQGTVWGPPLWNCFCADASDAIRRVSFDGVVFADDLNCLKVLPPQMSNESVLEECRRCQVELHKWGSANQVLFDPAKESFHVMHRSRGCGGNFVILGVEFDTALLMHDAARSIAVEAGW